MSAFITLRVLVTLVALFVVLAVESEGLPVPSSSPSPFKRSPSAGLVSTAPIPPLPALLMKREARKANSGSYQGKASSFTKRNAPDKDRMARSIEEKRNDLHSHIHEHIHGHYDDYDHDYYRGRYRPDWYSQEEIDHHSKHWAEHHGLLHDDRPYRDDDHVHVHEHIHDDKRDEQPQIKSETPYLTERGLIGDLVKPLLAPLNVIPGFITISNLLFGDGASDGLLKKLGGLVLHVEATKTPSSHHLYTFSLMASKHERTQIYLAPVNQSFAAQPSTDGANGTIIVKVTLPLLDATGSPILMCASYDTSPPSALNLETCGEDNDDSGKSNTSRSDTSQFFTYTPSTGALSPMYPGPSSEEANNSTSKLSARTILTTANSTDVIESTNTAPAAKSDEDTASTTSKSKLFLHFVPITAISNNNSAASDASPDTTATTAPTTVVKNMTTAFSDMPANRRNHIPTSVRLALQTSDDEGTEATAGSDYALDDEDSDASNGDDKGLVNDLNGPLSSEASSDEDDQPSRIFLAGNVDNDQVHDITTPESYDDNDDEEQEAPRKASAAVAPTPTKQLTQYDHFRSSAQPALPSSTSKCSCNSQV